MADSFLKINSIDFLLINSSDDKLLIKPTALQTLGTAKVDILRHTNTINILRVDVKSKLEN